MKKLYLGGALVAALLVTACAKAELSSQDTNKTQTPTASKKPYKVGKPYQIAGVWYRPEEDFSYDKTGVASWYGPNFHGKKTANGEIFDQNSITAAHPTLPMPTIARVTNLENGRSITVRINDRGPFAGGRIIDLSKRAAELLEFKNQGTAKVRVQVLADETKEVAGLIGNGAIAQPANLSTANTPSVGTVAQSPITVVELPAPTYASTPKQIPVQPVSQPIPEGTVRIQPYPYNAGTTQPAGEGINTLPANSGSVYVQAGSFADHNNASQMARQLSHIGTVKVQPALVNGQQFYRVRFGPLQKAEQADLLLTQLMNNGVTSAKVVVD